LTHFSHTLNNHLDRMASINDLAAAATAATSTTHPHPSLPSINTSLPPPQHARTPSATSSQKPPPGIIRGALVVLEGLDRSGKTTQVKLLEQRFVELGRAVKTLRFPDRTTPIGQMIDGYLRSTSGPQMDDHVIHLLFSANRWEAARTIAGLLAAGTTVICDRYYYSGVVYSAAKQNPSLSLSWARAPEVGLPRPDLVLFLDLDEEKARARGGWGGEVYEKSEMQRRVRELFWGLSMGKIGTAPAGTTTEEGEAGGAMVAVGAPSPVTVTGAETRFRQEEEDLQVVDAGGAVEEVAEEVWKVVRPRVEAVERGELGRVVRRVS
jgi:dTMP kinase